MRANGLTGQLGGGGIWLVYKARSGAKTHLILDVTGYYRASAARAGLPRARAGPDPGHPRRTVLTGLNGMFTAGTPRTLTPTATGASRGAKAVTGNLTVTGQTGGGYVSITPTPQAAPTTSSINFPARRHPRQRGHGAAPHGRQRQSLVYKSASGAKTHLILDVTGYFK